MGPTKISDPVPLASMTEVSQRVNTICSLYTGQGLRHFWRQTTGKPDRIAPVVVHDLILFLPPIPLRILAMFLFLGTADGVRRIGMKIPLGSKGSGYSYSSINIFERTSYPYPRLKCRLLYIGSGVGPTIFQEIWKLSVCLQAVSTVLSSQSKTFRCSASAQPSRALFQRLLDVNITATLHHLFFLCLLSVGSSFDPLRIRPI